MPAAWRLNYHHRQSHADYAYRPRKSATPKVRVVAEETKLPPTPSPTKVSSLEETMAKFAGMILDGIKKIQAPSSAQGAPPQVTPPTTVNENTGAEKKTAANKQTRKPSKRRNHSSSSSESGGEERRKRSPRKTASPTPLTRTLAFSCYGCGAPGVIRRNCSKCTPENAQQTK